MDDRWLSYAEAAQALSMTPESVRQRARREHWRKQLGNEGKALILVPGSLLEDTERVPAGDTDDDTPVSRPVKRPEVDAISVLQARIVEMDARATELRADLERERTERSGERQRTERLMDEVADLARQLANATATVGSTRTEVAGLTAQLAETKADRDAWRQEAVKPWWRRLVG